MQVDPVSFLPALQPVSLDPAALTVPAAASGPGFSAWLESEMKQTNARMIEADRQAQAFALGETENLHEVMLAIESARSQFQMMLQVRNKVLDAYQGLMQMQL